jgi:hypothetical protein
MSTVHVRPGVSKKANATGHGARDARISLYFLLWVVAAPFVGFLLAGDRMLDLGVSGDWEVWKAAVIGGLLAIPFGLGAYFGLRAVMRRFSIGWVGLLANVGLALLAIGMPIFEALTD